MANRMQNQNSIKNAGLTNLSHYRCKQIYYRISAHKPAHSQLQYQHEHESQQRERHTHTVSYFSSRRERLESRIRQAKPERPPRFSCLLKMRIRLTENGEITCTDGRHIPIADFDSRGGVSQSRRDELCLLLFALQSPPPASIRSLP